jgi:hypothetical protein
MVISIWHLQSGAGRYRNHQSQVEALAYGFAISRFNCGYGHEECGSGEDEYRFGD